MPIFKKQREDIFRDFTNGEYIHVAIDVDTSKGTAVSHRDLIFIGRYNNDLSRMDVKVFDVTSASNNSQYLDIGYFSIPCPDKKRIDYDDFKKQTHGFVSGYLQGHKF